MSILIAANDRELSAKKERFGDGFNAIGTPEMVIAQLQRYADAGSQYVTFHMPDASDVDPILLLGESVVPEVARM
jgi:alkanesulfonate monooxygenase SsuD/methylene tetrahydromethanopterin reductase-like flavin-dependent oxidoreductase (luciferase family)